MIQVSKGSGKMSGIRSVNTNPLTNPFCKQACKRKTLICGQCYSRYMLMTSRKNCVKSFEANGQELSEKLLADHELPRFPNDKVIRLHSHGELINLTHYQNFIRMAQLEPTTLFVLWTKRLDLVGQAERPKNLKIIYSNPCVNARLNYDEVIRTANIDGIYSVWTEEEAFRQGVAINCVGKCIDCMLCYGKMENPIVNAVEKNINTNCYAEAKNNAKEDGLGKEVGVTVFVSRENEKDFKKMLHDFLHDEVNCKAQWYPALI